MVGTVTAATESLRRWLLLATGALSLAGLFALLVAVARVPVLAPWAGKSYFHSALVGHVVFSLVVWFLLMEVVLWRYAFGDGGVGGGVGGGAGSRGYDRLAFSLCALGVAVAGIAALSGRGEPVLSHYVPWLRHPGFTVGLTMFAAGVALMAVPAAWRGLTGGDRSVSATGAGVSAAVVVAVLLSLILTGARLSGSPADPETVIRALFWGPGHILQFAHVAAMVTAWHLLLGPVGGPLGNPRTVRGILFLYLPGAAFGLIATAVGDPVALTASPFMSRLMAWGLGVPTGGVILLALGSVLTGSRFAGSRLAWREPTFTAVLAGLTTFTIGGGIAVAGLLEQNLRIPAHYHGVLGAVALAFMGFTYRLLGNAFPKGFNEVLARWQPYVYAVGVLGFVAGMSWAGGYGAPRKTPGFDWVQDPAVFIAMNLMGVGALFAAVGGAAYVINTGKALLLVPIRTPAERPDPGVLGGWSGADGGSAVSLEGSGSRR